MTSRDETLAAIRAASPEAKPLPTVAGEWIGYVDRLDQFAAAVRSVGGRVERVDSLGAIADRLDQMPAWRDARKIVSLVSEAGRPTLALDSIADPHELESVDGAIVPAEFGVAENGAVWVSDAGVRHRALYFIVQHLAVVVNEAAIVDNMHQAYERLRFGSPGFGMFLSGPSKTADIEQSLVIGAHGPRSLTVFLLGRAS